MCFAQRLEHFAPQVGVALGIDPLPVRQNLPVERGDKPLVRVIVSLSADRVHSFAEVVDCDDVSIAGNGHAAQPAQDVLKAHQVDADDAIDG